VKVSIVPNGKARTSLAGTNRSVTLVDRVGGAIGADQRRTRHEQAVVDALDGGGLGPVAVIGLGAGEWFARNLTGKVDRNSLIGQGKQNSIVPI